MKSFNTSMFVYLYNLIFLLICLRIILFICVYENSICRNRNRNNMEIGAIRQERTFFDFTYD